MRQCRTGGRCIYVESICDGFLNCYDRSDEDPEVCLTWQCPSNRWQCQNHLGCHYLETVCDGGVQCSDNSDESRALCKDWECPAGFAKDPAKLSCFWHKKVCFSDIFCKNASDEAGCRDHCDRCLISFWQSKNTLECLRVQYVCDGELDTLDGYDESPSLCCSANELPCMEKDNFGMYITHNCVDLRHICDGTPHCRQGDDELGCDKWNCVQGMWKCEGESKCIQRCQVCDGKYDCEYLSDEDTEFCRAWVCEPGWWKCRVDKVQCIPSHKECDETIDCKDRADLFCRNCTGDRWKCAVQRVCIDKTRVCNGKNDCPSVIEHDVINDTQHVLEDKSDEDPAMCATWPCPEGWSKCESKECIPIISVCDGKSHCQDGSDEDQEKCLAWNCPLQFRYFCRQQSCSTVILNL